MATEFGSKRRDFHAAMETDSDYAAFILPANLPKQRN